MHTHLFGPLVLNPSWPDSAAVSCEQLPVAGLHSSGVALRVVKSRETLKCLPSLSHHASQPIGEKALFEQSEYLGYRGNKNQKKPCLAKIMTWKHVNTSDFALSGF